MEQKLTIISTHDGKFHCDEVTAYTILNYIFPKNILHRSRDLGKLQMSDITIDVGGVYSPYENKFDHHQINCYETFTTKYKYPMSSAGMVYKHHGRMFISKMFSELNEELYTWFYKMFISNIDCIDNGIINDCYTKTGISSIIGMMNYQDTSNDRQQMINFKEAADLMLTTMKIVLTSKSKLLKTKSADLIKINKALDDVYTHDSKGRIIVFEGSCPSWKCLFSEYDDRKSNSIQFIVYPHKDCWRLGTIKKHGKIKTHIRSEEFLKHYFGNNLVFVHKNRFVAEFKTKETAIRAAIMSCR